MLGLSSGRSTSRMPMGVLEMNLVICTEMYGYTVTKS